MMKKVYFIYKNDKINSPSLYAITDKKDLKNSFMKERKKSLFVVKERELNKDEYNEIMKSSRSYLLGRRGFVTKPSSGYSTLKERCEVYLTATSKEEMDVFIKTDAVMLEVSKYTDEVSEVFNTKLMKALNTLKYYDLLAYRNNVYNTYSYFTQPLESTISSSDFKIDELGVFLYFYGYTLKGR